MAAGRVIRFKGVVKMGWIGRIGGGGLIKRAGRIRSVEDCNLLFNGSCQFVQCCFTEFMNFKNKESDNIQIPESDYIQI